MRIDQRIENIFSISAALQQNGRMKTMIFAKDHTVYIVNSDHSLILQFTIPLSSPGFSEQFSLDSNDYEGIQFEERNGKIVFTSQDDQYVKEKTCGKPDYDYEQIDGTFNVFEPFDNESILHLNSLIIKHLDQSLSHVEFSNSGKGFQIVQRSVYDGSTISIMKKTDNDHLFESSGDSSTPMEPIGIKTDDLIALFAYSNQITFRFPSNPQSIGYYWITSSECKMRGIGSFCIYDELGLLLPYSV